MPATPEQLALAKIYEPILLFHPGEQYQIVDAKRWFESSALWPSQSKFDDKAKWGFGPDPANPSVVFPRVPLLAPGLASLIPSETQPPQVNVTQDPGKYLLTHQGERELFLEFAGWEDSNEVSANSANLSANLAAIRDRTGGNEFAAFRPRYAVEIVETEALERLVVALRRDLNFAGLLKSIATAPRMVLYYFFYPGHDEDLLGCEIAVSKVRDGNFSGDWGCVAVLLDGSTPIWLGHSTHNSGPVEVAVKSVRVGMLVSPWSDVRLDGTHPFVFVARGTHGNYLSPGDKSRPSYSPAGTDISKTSCGAVEDAYNALRDGAKTANDALRIGETAKNAIVTVAKVVAGAAIGGPFGALIGGLASLAEASASDAPSVNVPPPLPENDPQDQPPTQTGPNTILVGRAVLSDGLTLPPDIQAAEVQRWISSDLSIAGKTYPFVVLRNEQPWWPRVGPDDLPGYEGRWGTRVQRDPAAYRCGMEFPDYRGLFFRELAIKLTSV